MNHTAIIPTLNPTQRLTQLVEQLVCLGLTQILVVDDGSDASCDGIFEQLKQTGGHNANVHVIHHDCNRGKGAAIKTALQAIGTVFPNSEGFVTVDGDGQHLPQDVYRVCAEQHAHPGEIVIGTRDFKSEGVPLRSRAGNTFCSLYFKLDTGKHCPDTQTGLRCIPTSLISFALEVEGTRYEYEMNFLLKAVKQGIAVRYVSIATVYEDGNSESHFDTVKDSLRIFASLARFTAASVASTIIDLTIFALIMAQIGAIYALAVPMATVLARMISGGVNFTLNRHWSFGSNGRASVEAVKYAILFVCLMCASSALVWMLAFLPIPIVVVKMLVDGSLFVVSYFVQHNWVFKNRGQKNLELPSPANVSENSNCDERRSRALGSNQND